MEVALWEHRPLLGDDGILDRWVLLSEGGYAVAWLREKTNGEWLFRLDIWSEYVTIPARSEKEAKATGVAIWRTET